MQRKSRKRFLPLSDSSLHKNSSYRSGLGKISRRDTAEIHDDIFESNADQTPMELVDDAPNFADDNNFNQAPNKKNNPQQQQQFRNGHEEEDEEEESLYFKKDEEESLAEAEYDDQEIMGGENQQNEEEEETEEEDDEDDEDDDDTVEGDGIDDEDKKSTHPYITIEKVIKDSGFNVLEMVDSQLEQLKIKLKKPLDDSALLHTHNTNITKGGFIRTLRSIVDRNKMSLQAETELLNLIHQSFGSINGGLNLPLSNTNNSSSNILVVDDDATNTTATNTTTSSYEDYLSDNYCLLTFDVCRNNDFVFVGAHRNRTHCLHCNEFRYKPCPVCRKVDHCIHSLRNRSAHRTIQYRPLITVIYQLLNTKKFVDAILYNNIDSKYAGDDNEYFDIMDADVPKANMEELKMKYEKWNQQQQHAFHRGKHVIHIPLLFRLMYDGAQIFKSIYSVFWPLFIGIINLPPCARHALGGGLFLSTLYTSEKDSFLEYFILNHCLIPELKRLEQGFSVEIDNILYYVNGRMILHVLDTPALSKHLGCKHRGNAYCMLCRLVKGCYRKSIKRSVYTGHRRLLPQNNFLRFRGQFLNCCPDNFYIDASIFVQALKDAIVKLPEDSNSVCVRLYRELNKHQKTKHLKLCKDAIKIDELNTIGDQRTYVNDEEYMKCFLESPDKSYLFYPFFDFRKYKEYKRVEDKTYIKNGRKADQRRISVKGVFGEWLFYKQLPYASIKLHACWDGFHALMNWVDRLMELLRGGPNFGSMQGNRHTVAVRKHCRALRSHASLYKYTSLTSDQAISLLVPTKSKEEKQSTKVANTAVYKKKFSSSGSSSHHSAASSSSSTEKLLPEEETTKKSDVHFLCEDFRPVYELPRNIVYKIDAWVNSINIPTGYANEFQIMFPMQRKGFLRGTSMIQLMSALMDFILLAVPLAELPKQYRSFLSLSSILYSIMLRPSIKKDVLYDFEKQITELVSMFEGLFPESEMQLTVHQLIDIVHYIKHMGPISGWWTLPVERAIGTMKQFLPKGGASMESVVTKRYLRYETSELLNFYNGVSDDDNRRVGESPSSSTTTTHPHQQKQKVTLKLFNNPSTFVKPSGQIIFTDRTFAFPKERISSSSPYNTTGATRNKFLASRYELSHLLDSMIDSIIYRLNNDLNKAIEVSSLMRLYIHYETHLYKTNSILQWNRKDLSDKHKLKSNEHEPNEFLNFILEMYWFLTSINQGLIGLKIDAFRRVVYNVDEVFCPLLVEEGYSLKTHIVDKGKLLKTEIQTIKDIIEGNVSIRIENYCDILGTTLRGRGIHCREIEPPTIRENETFIPRNPHNVLKENWHERKQFSSWCKFRSELDDESNKLQIGQINAFLCIQFKSDTYLDGSIFASVTCRRAIPQNNSHYIPGKDNNMNIILAHKDSLSYDSTKLFVDVVQIVPTPLLVCGIENVDNATLYNQIKPTINDIVKSARPILLENGNIRKSFAQSADKVSEMYSKENSDRVFAIILLDLLRHRNYIKYNNAFDNFVRVNKLNNPKSSVNYASIVFENSFGRIK